jgi:hypothetical protein
MQKREALMSKYRVHKGVIKSTAAILAAIEDRIVKRLGVGLSAEQKTARRDEFCALAHQIVEGEVKVHLDKQVPLYGYKGDMRSERANIRIPKEVVNRYLGGGASNDVGFAKTAEGFDAIVSEYDKGSWWSNAESRFWQAAAVYETKELAELNGYTVSVEEAEDGMMHVTCESGF